jgi:hypothetical protein
MPAKLVSGDSRRRFLLWGRALGGVAVLTERCERRCWPGDGPEPAMDAWRAWCSTVVGGVAREAGVPVPVEVWGAMPIIICCCRDSWHRERNVSFTDDSRLDQLH